MELKNIWKDRKGSKVFESSSHESITWAVFHYEAESCTIKRSEKTELKNLKKNDEHVMKVHGQTNQWKSLTLTDS